MTQGNLLTATAGDEVCFSLKACDSYSNLHTTGGAIYAAVIKGAGQRDFDLSSFTPLEDLRQRLSQAVRADVICLMSDKGNGMYTFSGCVFTAGIHDIVVTSIDHTSFTMGRVRVIPATPYAKHCRLELDSVYQTEPEVSKKYTILLNLYDEFFNACNSQRVSLKEIQVSIGQQHLQSFPHYRDRNKLCFSFIPISSGAVKLLVSISGELVPECPLALTVRVVTESFLKRFSTLRRYLQMSVCCYYTPTLTIDRNNLLESAVNMLNVGDYFRRTIRVRFRDEPGIDTGGLSRYGTGCVNYSTCLGMYLCIHVL